MNIPLVRECGECHQCCKTMRVDDLDEPKPCGQWCKHIEHTAKPCTIYTDRPPSCHNFRCAWLDGHFPDWARPDRMKMVPVIGRNERAGNQEFFAFHVDQPGDELRPGAVRLMQALANSDVSSLVCHKGKAVRILCGNGEKGACMASLARESSQNSSMAR